MSEELPPLRALTETVPLVGRLDWIGAATEKRGTMLTPPEAVLAVGTGIEGERHALGGLGKRQVTLIQAEHLPVIAALLDRENVAPQDLRRNLMVSGVNVWALRALRFWVGEVLLEGTGPCAPCSRMEETLGPGGYHAMRGHGGITARVLEPGTIRLGDAVRGA